MATTIDLGAAEKKAPFGNLHVLVMCGLGRDVITWNHGRLKLYLHVTLRPEGVHLCLCVLLAEFFVSCSWFIYVQINNARHLALLKL